MATHFLDRWPARAVALGVMLLAGGGLAYMHRADIALLTGTAGGEKAANDPLSLCIAQRVGEVEQMRKDGLIDDARLALFKSRAEAVCRSQFGG